MNGRAFSATSQRTSPDHHAFDPLRDGPALSLWAALLAAHPWEAVLHVGLARPWFLTATAPAGAQQIAFEPDEGLRSRATDEVGQAAGLTVEPVDVSVSRHAADGQGTPLDLYLDHRPGSVCMRIDTTDPGQVLYGAAGLVSSSTRIAIMARLPAGKEEISHLLRDWRLMMYDRRVRRLIRVPPDALAHLDALRASTWLHPTDAVLLSNRDAAWRPV